MLSARAPNDAARCGRALVYLMAEYRGRCRVACAVDVSRARLGNVLCVDFEHLEDAWLVDDRSLRGLLYRRVCLHLLYGVHDVSRACRLGHRIDDRRR